VVSVDQSQKEQGHQYSDKNNTHSGVDGMVFTMLMRTMAHCISFILRGEIHLRHIQHSISCCQKEQTQWGGINLFLEFRRLAIDLAEGVAAEMS